MTDQPGKRFSFVSNALPADTFTVVRAEVPLANMFGYATIVRSLSQGMAGFTMELCRFGRVPTKIAEEIIATRRKEQAAKK